jgi:UPF0716 protein FxsA
VPLLILAFIVVPLAELYVIIQVGQAIGVLPTIAILLADSVLGSALLRSQGRGAWRRFNEALAANRVPAREVLDGVLIIFGGAFLITPGFITDVIGLLLLIPPTRAAIRRLSARVLRGRLATGPRVAVWGFGRARQRGHPRSQPGWWGEGPPRPPPSPGSRPGDIEGTATEVRDRESLPGREPSDDIPSTEPAEPEDERL